LAEGPGPQMAGRPALDGADLGAEDEPDAGPGGALGIRIAHQKRVHREAAVPRASWGEAGEG